MAKLKTVAKKLRKSLLLGGKKWNSNSADDHHQFTNAPEDVKEGHFAVIAMDKDEPKRFVVPLNYLNNPTFLRMLEQAAEEYDFVHEGALTIPCQPRELERLLTGGATLD